MPGQEKDGPKAAKIFVCRNPDFKTPGPRSKASKLPMSPGMANAINNAKKFQQGAISATPLRGPYRFLTVINPITPVVENEESLEEEIEDQIMNSPVHPQVNQLKKVTPSKRIPFSPIPHVVANSPTRQRLSPHTSIGLQNHSNSQIVRDKITPKTTPTREFAENPSAEISTPSARTRNSSRLSLGGDGEADKTASPMPCPEKENTPKSSQNRLEEEEEIIDTEAPTLEGLAPTPCEGLAPSPGIDSSVSTLPTETPKTTNASFLSGANVTCEKRSRARKKLSVATPLLDKSSTPPRNQPQSTVKETPRFSFDSPFFKMPLPPKAKVIKKPFVLRKTVPSSQSKINKSHQSEIAKVPAFYLNPTPRGTKRVILNEDESNDEEIESTKKKAKVRRRAMDHSFDLSMIEIEPEPIPGPSGTKSKNVKNFVNADSDSSDDFLDNQSVNERRNATITTANKKRPLTKKELAAQAEMAKDKIDNQHQEVEKNTSKSRKRPASKKQQPDQNSNTKKANVKLTIQEPSKPSASVYDSEDTLDLLYEKARYVTNWIPKMKGKRMIVEGDLLDFQ